MESGHPINNEDVDKSKKNRKAKVTRKKELSLQEKNKQEIEEMLFVLDSNLTYDAWILQQQETFLQALRPEFRQKAIEIMNKYKEKEI